MGYGYRTHARGRATRPSLIIRIQRLLTALPARARPSFSRSRSQRTRNGSTVWKIVCTAPKLASAARMEPARLVRACPKMQSGPISWPLRLHDAAMLARVASSGMISTEMIWQSASAAQSFFPKCCRRTSALRFHDSRHGPMQSMRALLTGGSASTGSIGRPWRTCAVQRRSQIRIFVRVWHPAK